MTKKYKPMSECGLAAKETLKQVEMQQYLLADALRRHHEAMANLALHHNCDPEEFTITGGPGGNK